VQTPQGAPGKPFQPISAAIASNMETTTSRSAALSPSGDWISE